MIPLPSYDSVSVIGICDTLPKTKSYQTKPAIHCFVQSEVYFWQVESEIKLGGIWNYELILSELYMVMSIFIAIFYPLQTNFSFLFTKKEQEETSPSYFKWNTIKSTESLSTHSIKKLLLELLYGNVWLILILSCIYSIFLKVFEVNVISHPEEVHFPANRV